MSTEPKPKSFRRRFIEYATGTGVAQAISLVLMPIVSRLYTPEQMGEYAIITSFATILSVVGNMRFDAPIVIAKDDAEARDLVAIGQGLAVTWAAAVLVVFWPLAYAGLLGGITPYAVAMIACSGALISCIASLVQYLNRLKRYRQLAVRSGLERLAGISISIGLGTCGLLTYGLPFGQTLGLMVSLVFLFRAARIDWPRFDARRLRATAYAYRAFPKQNLPSGLLNTCSTFGPPLLFAAYFAKKELGGYNLVGRVFDVPIYLVGFTFYTVYYQHLSERTVPERRALFWKSLKVIAGGAVVPFLIVGLNGEWLFTRIFGPQWAEAGRFATWLAPMSLVRLCFVSQVSILLVQRELTVDLLINVAQFVAQVAGFAIGYLAFGSVLACVGFMCGGAILVYGLGLVFIYRTLGDPDALNAPRQSTQGP